MKRGLVFGKMRCRVCIGWERPGTMRCRWGIGGEGHVADVMDGDSAVRGCGSQGSNMRTRNWFVVFVNVTHTLVLASILIDYCHHFFLLIGYEIVTYDFIIYKTNFHNHVRRNFLEFKLMDEIRLTWITYIFICCILSLNYKIMDWS